MDGLKERKPLAHISIEWATESLRRKRKIFDDKENVNCDTY